MKQLPRQHLYDLVWSRPIREVAPQFQISDVALAKTCKRANIPVPERGYWAKKQAGKTTIQKPLPPRGLGMADDVSVGGQPRWGGFLTEAEILGPIPPTPQFKEPIAEVAARALELVGKVTIPRVEKLAHPAIAKLLARDQQRRENLLRSEFAFSWDKPKFDTRFDLRRLRILNALFLATAKAGGKGFVRDQDAREIGMQVGVQHVSLALDRMNPRKSGRGNEDTPSRESEKLHLQIGPPEGNEVRTSWEDGEGKGDRIEKSIQEIAVNILVCGEVNYRHSCEGLYKWRIERRAALEEEIRRQKAEAERKEQERRRAQEKARVDSLLQQAAALRNAHEIRAYVEAVRSADTKSLDPISDTKLSAWSIWALTQADSIDPIKSRAYRSFLTFDVRTVTD